jgi:hypothetical protein
MKTLPKLGGQKWTLVFIFCLIWKLKIMIIIKKIFIIIVFIYRI